MGLRETDAMQFILDLLTDGIITSAVQQIGFTPHDKVTETDLPFVQVYSPINENQQQEIRQDPGVLTFQLDIIDVRGRSNALRQAIAELDETLRIDKSWQGTVEKGFVTLRSVAERKVDERAVVGAVINLQIEEGLPEPNRVSLIDFSDVTKFSIDADALIENSTFVHGTIGIKKNATANQTVLTIEEGTAEFPFPLDLTVTNRVRFLTYVNPENSFFALFNFELKLGSDGGSRTSTYATTGLVGNGWSFPSYDLSDPRLTGGGGVDLSNVQAVQFLYNFNFFPAFVSTTYGILAADFGYYSRDTGLNNGRGYHPGF
jgi:hypothetical protein